jgi:hypothetical protein
MAKIIGNTTATPNLLSDWNQNDATKADYIKNKPTNVSDFENDAGYINTVDSELSADSTNPVQNKAVAEAIDSLNTLVGDSSVAEQIQNALDEQSSTDSYTKSEIDNMVFITIADIDEICGATIQSEDEVVL